MIWVSSLALVMRQPPRPGGEAAVPWHAPPQTDAFLNLLTGLKYQTATAASGIYQPSVPAANPAITDTLLQQPAAELAS